MKRIIILTWCWLLVHLIVGGCSNPTEPVCSESLTYDRAYHCALREHFAKHGHGNGPFDLCCTYYDGNTDTTIIHCIEHIGL